MLVVVYSLLVIVRKHFREQWSFIDHWEFRIIIKSVKVCKYMTKTSYIWGYYHMITNHTIYVRRGTTSTVYFICKCRTNKTDRYQDRLYAAGDKGQRIHKVTKLNQSKQSMEGGLQEEPVEYGVSMPSPQLSLLFLIVYRSFNTIIVRFTHNDIIWRNNIFNICFYKLKNTKGTIYC